MEVELRPIRTRMNGNRSMQMTLSQYGIAFRRPQDLRRFVTGPNTLEALAAYRTALQARNVELFGRYDRLVAEASFRLNISMPLAAVMELVIWRSPLPVLMQLGLSLAPAALAATLLRQSLIRVRAANQVLVMSEAVGVFE